MARSWHKSWEELITPCVIRRRYSDFESVQLDLPKFRLGQLGNLLKLACCTLVYLHCGAGLDTSFNRWKIVVRGAVLNIGFRGAVLNIGLFKYSIDLFTSSQYSKIETSSLMWENSIEL